MGDGVARRKRRAERIIDAAVDCRVPAHPQWETDCAPPHHVDGVRRFGRVPRLLSRLSRGVNALYRQRFPQISGDRADPADLFDDSVQPHCAGGSGSNSGRNHNIPWAEITVGTASKDRKGDVSNLALRICHRCYHLFDVVPLADAMKPSDWVFQRL